MAIPEYHMKYLDRKSRCISFSKQCLIDFLGSLKRDLMKTRSFLPEGLMHHLPNNQPFSGYLSCDDDDDELFPVPEFSCPITGN